MPNQFYYQPLPTGRDEREGWLGRTQRPGGDINLPPEEPELPPLPASPALAHLMPKPYQGAAVPEFSGNDVMHANQFDVPVYGDPSKTTRGTMEYNGPRLNTEEALSGLKAHDFNSTYSPGMSTEEMFRLAGRPENSFDAHGQLTGGTAPGAAQYWQHQLADRLGPQQKMQDAKIDDQIGIEHAGAQLNPDVQQAEENTAQRHSYPSQYQAQGMVGSQVGAANAAGEWDLRKQKLIESGVDAKSADAILQALLGLRSRTMGIANKSPEDSALEQQIDPSIMAGLKSRSFLK